MSSVGAFIRFAFGSIFRNRRRAISAMIGIILAVTLIAGENIAIDTTASSALMNALEAVQVDFIASASSSDYMNVTSTIAKVENVEYVEPIYRIGYVEVGASISSTDYYGDIVGVRTEFEEVIDRLDITGTFALENGTAVLSSNVANSVGVEIGDTICLSNTIRNFENGIWRNYTHFLNLTVSGIINFKEESSYEREFYYWTLITSQTVFVNIFESSYIEEELNLTYHPWVNNSHYMVGAKMQYFIWIDRDKLIDINDLDGSKTSINQIKKRIELTGMEYGISVYDSDLEMVINAYSSRMVFFRLSMLALSLPVIALGFYLGILGIELGMNERRREIGILKSRGVSNRQILLMLLFESIILGIIAGVVGLLCGLLSSRAFLGLGGQEVGLFDIAVSDVSIAISILLAIVLMLIAVIRPARRISKIPIVEALHYYSKEEVKKRYKPTRDIIMILIAALTYFFMVAFDPATFFQGSFSFLTLIALIFFMLAPILIPFSPFFLIFGLTRLLTRSTNKIYSAVSHATKFFTKDMWYVVNKNLVRNPKRASRVCVIIALALAFGIFTMTFMDTSIAFEEKKIRAEIGSDIHIISYTENRSFENNLSAVDGVDMVASASFTSCNVGSEYASICAFNSSAYCEIIELEDYYFIEGNPGVLAALGDGENAVINERLADEFGFHVGDMLPVKIYYDPYDGFAEGIDHTFNYQIVGIVKYLPGLQLWGYGMFGDNTVLVDFSKINVTLFDHRESCFLVKVKNGFAHEEVANDIENLYPNEVGNIRVFQVELDRVKNDPMFGAFLYFLEIEYAFVLLIATVGIGLIMFVAAREREQEIANIIARGASTKQIFSLFLGEGFTIMLIGILIGSGTGLLTAYAFNEMIAIDPYQLVERTLILSPSLAILIFASIIALMFTIAIVSLKAARIKLHQALRIRGG